ncbi:hypothetical protein EII34_04500 [Arachnia propionica]|uniref:DNA-binding protein n=1 Tax=Arachnia propionica TaxID=1750 RepID=A0A3P1T931_9ACTN|nr:hypothetical protein [Arachnia propionica]RRD05952.1 hypothetical protein EII34_04500 [Arachnia propionica]
MINDIRTAELGGVATSPVADTTPLVARSYTHPMMDGRTVVRLVREPLTEAEDIALAVLGLAPDASRPVGHVRAQAIGFPAWPILNDPANARHAVNLVGDLHRAERLARSKPKAARTMLDDLATRLASSAPHFLPTFLEEAARIFLAQENRQYAGAYFTKARTVERVHNVPIDEERHRHALLEFALAGVLSAKELTIEAKALLDRCEPAAALEQFIQLIIGRANGGVPPHSSLQKDIQRLVNAAGAQQSEVDQRLLTALLRSPSLGTAPQSFWETYSQPLATMARNSGEVRRALFTLTPGTVTMRTWLDLLEAGGVLEEMRSDTLDVTDWLRRFVLRESQRSSVLPAELSQFIRSLPRLGGRTISFRCPPVRVTAELVDALLSRGCRVEFIESSNPDRQRLRLGGWLWDDRRSDLTHLAASEHASKAAAALDEVDLDGLLDVLVAHEGSRQLLHRWATTTLTEDSTAPEFFKEFDRLKPLYTPTTRAELDTELSHFETLADPAELTAKAIRDGLLTELTWPALEAAASELGYDEADPDEVSIQESWPWFGVTRKNRIIWVKGDERGADVTIDVPHGDRFFQWAWFRVGEDTACLSWTDSRDKHLTWASDPANHHRMSPYWVHRSFHDISLETEAGRLIGAGILRPAATAFPEEELGHVLQEGSSYWGHKIGYDSWPVFQELAPARGTLGRRSLPPRLADLVEADLRDGFSLIPSLTQWMPATPDTVNSPLGVADGQHGWVLLERDGEFRAHAIDGFSWRGTEAQDVTWLGGRLSRPGGGHWLIHLDGALHLESLAPLTTASAADGRPHLLHRLPLAGWHHLRIRDEAVSTRMRTIQAADVADLIATLPEWTTGEPACLPATVVEAAERLLGTTDPALSVAVGWLALRITHQVQRLQQLRESCRREEAATFSRWRPSNEAVSWLWGFDVPSRDSLRQVSDALAGRLKEMDHIGPTTRTCLLHPELLLAGACSPFASVEVIQGAAAAFGAILDSGLHVPEATIFSVQLRESPYYGTRQAFENGNLVGTPTGPAVVLSSYGAVFWREFHFFSPGGGIPDEVKDTPTELVGRSSGIDLDTHRAAFESLLTDGGPEWDPTAPERFAEATGWSLPAAKIFLAGISWRGCSRRGRLSKEVRELLGLKVVDARTAEEFLEGLDDGLLMKLVRAGASDPMRTVRHGLDVDAMIACWKANAGDTTSLPEDDTVVLPEDILADAEPAVRYHGSNRGVDHLTTDEASLDDLPGWLWLAARLPLNDPLRPWLADRLEPMLTTSLDRQIEGNMYSDTKDRVRAILGLPTFAATAQGTIQQVGPWTLTRGEHDDQLTFDPAKVEDWELELQRARTMRTVSSYWSRRIADLAAVAAGHFAVFQEWLRTPGDGWAPDPMTSAPEIVAEVQAALDLPEDSARYWLQLLALPNPTDKNIGTWNGWKRAHRVKAAAPLVEKGLIIEAKRARAGRSYFLPGGWLEATTPHLPLEAWKAPFYDLEDIPKLEQHHDIVVPRVPLPQLFADAWQRHQGGDVPGYVELRTERTRR